MSRKRMTAAMILALCSAPAWTAEFAYDFVVCSHGTQKLLDSGPELTALGFEDWGITASSTTKEWESATTRCVGHVLIAGERTTGKGRLPLGAGQRRHRSGRVGNGSRRTEQLGSGWPAPAGWPCAVAAPSSGSAGRPWSPVRASPADMTGASTPCRSPDCDGADSCAPAAPRRADQALQGQPRLQQSGLWRPVQSALITTNTPGDPRRAGPEPCADARKPHPSRPCV